MDTSNDAHGNDDENRVVSPRLQWYVGYAELHSKVEGDTVRDSTCSSGRWLRGRGMEIALRYGNVHVRFSLEAGASHLESLLAVG